MESRRSTEAENGHTNGSTIQEESYDETIINDLLQGRENPSLQGLDMGAIKKQTYERTRQAMAAFNPIIARKVMPKADNYSKEDKAAICIQSHVRGFLARRLYVDLLYEQYEKEEQERLERERQQVEEGELLVENYKLQTEMNENRCIRRNQRRNLDCTAVTIQRAWRDYRRRQYKNSITLPHHENLNPLSSAVNNIEDKLFIRTNPFDVINHGPCDEDYEEEPNDVFNDSLEQVTENTSQPTISTSDCHESELSEYSPTDIETMEFPSPTTDWESIESCLNSKEETQDNINIECSDLADKRLTDFKMKANDLRICFVDDTLSDDDDEDGLDIKEYVIDKQDIEDEEKRDSGCVGDEEENKSFCIKTVSPDELVNCSLSEQETQHVMLELSRHEENQEKELTVQGWTVEKLQVLMLHELKALKDNLAQLIQAQNEVLVRELMMRDSLHLKQDSMLLEVEDSSKNDEQESTSS